MRHASLVGDGPSVVYGPPHSLLSIDYLSRLAKKHYHHTICRAHFTKRPIFPLTCASQSHHSSSCFSIPNRPFWDHQFPNARVQLQCHPIGAASCRGAFWHFFCQYRDGLISFIASTYSCSLAVRSWFLWTTLWTDCPKFLAMFCRSITSKKCFFHNIRLPPPIPSLLLPCTSFLFPDNLTSSDRSVHANRVPCHCYHVFLDEKEVSRHSCRGMQSHSVCAGLHRSVPHAPSRPSTCTGCRCLNSLSRITNDGRPPPKPKTTPSSWRARSERH